MKTKIILFIVTLLVWLGLTWSAELLSLMVGVGVAILVAFLISDMFISKVPEFRQPVRYLWFLYYIPVFLWECLKANFDVAYRVGHPDLPINPGIVKVKTQLKTEIAITFLANSITLTPGTLSVDVDKEKGYLYVHWIN
ncbi:MAG: Na+/H+ antiporter subunit E, partial [Candidatus Omnitrophica bacterium]|nr:Na+/H+ antiporter subunit E [Candidatus Omnitrophota bacterium]